MYVGKYKLKIIDKIYNKNPFNQVYILYIRNRFIKPNDNKFWEFILI